MREAFRVMTIPVIAGLVWADSFLQQDMLAALGANGKRMMSFQWKQRTTVIRGGDASEPTIEELRFDSNGQLQRTTLAIPPEKRMGPLRSRKAVSVKESVHETMALARRYADPRLLAKVIQSGEIWEGPGKIRVNGKSSVLPGDTVTLSIDDRTLLTSKVDVESRHDGSPMRIAIYYDALPNGPSVMTRMTVDLPDDNIAVHVRSSDFVNSPG